MSLRNYARGSSRRMLANGRETPASLDSPVPRWSWRFQRPSALDVSGLLVGEIRVITNDYMRAARASAIFISESESSE
jgi:hypothetical protein